MSHSPLSLSALKAQLRALSLRVLSLEERAAQAEGRLASVEESVREDSNGGFDLIAEASSSERASPAVRSQTQGSAADSEISSSDTQGRRLLAEEIGRFLRRAVNGEHKGTSGRDRLKLQNRLYIVPSDFEGNRLSEPRVETSFTIVKGICKRGADCGSSIFVGFATRTIIWMATRCWPWAA